MQKADRDLKARGYDRRLLTCNPEATAAPFERGNVFVFPKNREPSTPHQSGDPDICTVQNERVICAQCI
jgi:hypothetical protein